MDRNIVEKEHACSSHRSFFRVGNGIALRTVCKFAMAKVFRFTVHCRGAFRMRKGAIAATKLSWPLWHATPFNSVFDVCIFRRCTTLPAVATDADFLRPTAELATARRTVA